MATMTAQQFGEASLTILRALPKNPDGTVGAYLTGANPDFWDWVEFFEAANMPFRAGYYRAQAEKGAYFVAPSPCHVDAAFVPRGRARPRPVNDLSADERDRLAERVKASWQAVPKGRRGRYAQEDARVEQHPLPEARELTESEVESLCWLIGARDAS